MPADVDAYETIFGGLLMSLMDSGAGPFVAVEAANTSRVIETGPVKQEN